MHVTTTKVALAIGAFFLCLYAFSATTVPTGIADSDELVQTSYFLSVPHPPGFPLFTILGHMGISTLNIITNPAHATNLLSGLYTAIALIFFFLTGKMIYRSKVASLVSTILLGSSYFIWTYATIYEITSFTLLLASITLYYSLNWYRFPTKKNFYLTWIFAGILLSHFHPAILYFPAFLWLIITKKKLTSPSFIAGLATLSFTAIIFSLSLFLLNTNSPLSWDVSPGIQGWWQHITRQDYIGFNEESGTLYQTSFAAPLLLNPIALQSAIHYLKMLVNHLNIIIALIIISGYFHLWKKDRTLFWFQTILFVISGPLFAAYMQISNYTFQTNLLIGTAERHLILGELAAAMLILPGIQFIQQHLKSKNALTIFLIATIGSQLFYNKDILLKPEVRSFNYRLQKQKVETVAKNSLIICSTDIDCYSLWYVSRIERIRPDVTILSHVPVYSTHYLKSHPDIYPFDQNTNPNYLSLLIAHNYHRRPIYFSSGIGFYDTYLGLENGPFFLVPESNLFRLTTQYPKEAGSQPTSIVPPNIDRRNLYPLGIIEALANNQAYAGYLWLKYGQTNTANQFLATAATLDPANAQTQELIHNQELIISSIAVPDPNLSPQKLITLAKEAKTNQQPDVANTYYRFAFLSGGNDPKIITAALEYYQQTNNLPMIKDLNQLLRYNSPVPE